MVIKKQTIGEFAEQIRKCMPLDGMILLKAKESTLTTSNNANLNSLVGMWLEGWYDEKPTDVIPQLRKILKLR